MDSRYPFKVDFSLIEHFRDRAWHIQPTAQQLRQICAEYKQSGYLGKPVGVIAEVRNVTEKVQTAKFSPALGFKLALWLMLSSLSALWSLTHFLILLFGIKLPEMQSGFWNRLFPGYDFWHWWWARASNGFLPGFPAFNEKITGYLITHTLIGAIAAFIFYGFYYAARDLGFYVGFGFIENKSEVSDRVILSQHRTTADALVEEVAVVYRNGEREEFARKAPASKYSFKPLKVGQKISRYDNNILFESDMESTYWKLTKKAQAEEERSKKRAEEDRQRQRELDAYRAEQAAIKAKRERIKACRFDDWKPVAGEPWVFELPSVWQPFVTVGLAYANVVPYGSLPPEQVRRLDGTMVTTGPTPISKRGVYLIGPVHQRTINKQALVVNPLHLPGTTTNDLTIFGLDRNGNVLFVLNPARHEKEIRFQSDEAEEKFRMLGPILAKLFDKAVSTNDQSGGWA